MRCLIWVVFLFSSNYLAAQLNPKYTFRHLNQNDGLLHTTILGIVGDEKGFIWILTPNGLQRYDGYRFVHHPQIVNLSDLNRSSLLFDEDEKYVGVYRYNKIHRIIPGSDTLIPVSVSELLSKDSLPPVSFPMADGRNWVIGESGVIKHELDTTLDLISYTGSGLNKGYYVIKDPTSGKFWIPDFHNFALADPVTRTIERYSDPDPKHPLLKHLKAAFPESLVLQHATLDSDLNLWIVSWKDYLIRYNLRTQEFYTYSLNAIKKRQERGQDDNVTLLVNSIYEDRQGQVWITTDYLGLLLFNKSKNDFDFITSDVKITNGIEYSFRVISMFQDRNDNLWVGTDRGISIFNPYHDQVQSYRMKEVVPDAIPKYGINDLIETDNGEILVGTWGGGITIFDTDFNFIRNVTFDGHVFKNMVWSFIRHDNGQIWAGTQGGFIHMYDPTTHQFETIQPPEIGRVTIRTMAKDSNGNVLMGLHNGKIAMWVKRENKFYGYNDAADKTSADLIPVVNIFVDSQNHCWASLEVDFKEFDSEQMAFSGYYTVRDRNHEVPQRILGLASLTDSTLLVGTRYAGLQVFNMRSKKYTPFIDAKDVREATVYAVKQDAHKNIWFTTDFGLYKRTQEGNLVRYNFDHAILHNALESTRLYTLQDGRLVTFSSGEIICFNPENLDLQDDIPLKVEISSFKVFEKEIHIDSLLANKVPVVLRHDQNFFSIEFSALQFIDLRHAYYYYRLRDVDKNWIYSDSRRYADYTDIKPGEYVFEIRASYGDVMSHITAIPIIIMPPWWATAWFRLICAAGLIALAYIMIRKRILLIRKEASLKHRVAETEMMALRSQMNPHFIFNCINGIDGLIQRDDKYHATMYLNKFAKLIRNVLDSSRENRVVISKDLETLQLYIDLEMFRHPGKFTATLEADPELLSGDYKVPPLIIQPYVENAILHGIRGRTDGNGMLSVKVEKREDAILYTIEDNGVGRQLQNGHVTKENVGYGMQMSSDRIRLFNDEEMASVQVCDVVTDAAITGTRVNVQLKIQ